MRRISTLLLALVLTGLFVSPAMAQLFKEDFTGAVGDTIDGHGFVIGTPASYSNPIKIVSPGLTFGSYIGSGVGNAAGMKVNGQDLVAPFAADSIGSIYAAFMINISTIGSGDYFFGFIPTTSANNYTGRFFVKTDSAGGFFVGCTKNNEVPQTYGTTHFALNTTYLIVYKFTFLPGDTNDVCSVFAFKDGNVPTTEPGMPELIYDGHMKADPRAFNAFVLRQGGGNGVAPILSIDGIRVDTTWAGVLGLSTGEGPAFGVAPKPLDFGNGWANESKFDTLTVTNNSSTGTLRVDSIKSTNASFYAVWDSIPVTIAAAQSAKFAVAFHPVAAGADSGFIKFYSYYGGAEHRDSATVKGFGVQKVAALVFRNNHLAIGRVLVGQTKTDTVWYKNSGQLALTLNGLTGKDTASFTPGLWATTVPAGDSSFVTVKFKPQSAGDKFDTVVVASNVPEGFDTLYVSGTGALPAPVFALSPKSIAFGNIRAGQQKTDSLLLKNTGEVTLKISGFTQKDTTFHFFSVPDSVKAGDSVRLYVTFTPKATGSFKDTTVFTSNAAEATDTVFFSGSSSDVITIAAARALTVGSEVIIRGIVTRTLGSYTFFQDTTGGMILYSNAAGAPAHDSVATGYIQKGDLLEVHGKTSEYAALMEIGGADIIDFTRISRGNALPSPKVVTLAEVMANGEQYEAQLVQIKKLSFFSTPSTMTFANKTSYKVVDSSNATGTVVLRIQGATDTWLGGMDVPTNTFTFTGPLGQFTYSTGGYQLLPVDSSDVAADVIEGIAGMPNGVPATYDLAQNFPNPFNPTTTIQYALPAESHVIVKIYNMLGQEVRTLVSETQRASYYRVVWDGRNQFGATVASGLYFYRIAAEPVAKSGSPFVAVKKMMMLK